MRLGLLVEDKNISSISTVPFQFLIALFPGYFLLAGRCRNVQEAVIVQEVIQKHMKRKIDVNCLFGHPSSAKLSSFSEKLLSELIRDCPDEFGHVVFTYNMRRLAVLVARALQFNEPVLLVGETG